MWYANQDIDHLILKLVHEVGVPNDPHHFLTRFIETTSAIPSALEYFVREVTSFNSVSRLVLGAEFAPGFAGIEDVGAQGRLYSGLELVLFSSFPAGRSGGVTHTRSFARCTGSGAPVSGGSDVLNQSYRLGTGQSRLPALTHNRAAYDEFIEAGGTLTSRRSEQLFSPTSGKPINGYFDQDNYEIVLGKGSNLSTITEELIHFRQAQRYSTGRIPRQDVDLMEFDAAKQLRRMGFDPE